MPQQYFTVPGPTERDAPAESAPAGVREGQRRSGGGNAHGILPVPPEAKGDPVRVLNLGGTTKRNRSRPKAAGRERFIILRPRCIPGSDPHPTKKEF